MGGRIEIIHEAKIHLFLVRFVYRDIGRSYISTPKHEHKRKRAPTRAREHKKSGMRKGPSREADLLILRSRSDGEHKGPFEGLRTFYLYL